MAVIEISPTAVATLFLQNLLAPMFIFADKSLVILGGKFKFLEFLRHLLITWFLFLLRFIPSLIQICNDINHLIKPPKNENYLLADGGDSGIARALLQILSIINEIPVSSRKYEVVRCLAERIIEENQRENFQILNEVNRKSLSAAFERTLTQLEAAVVELGYDPIEKGGTGSGHCWVLYRLNRVLKVVKSVKEGTWVGWAGKEREVERSEEKLAAELLWLAQKLAAYDCGEEAVWRWASASNLASLALSAEPRLQGSLVKVSAFLFKQAKDLGLEEELEEGKKQQQRQGKKKMLMAWLPLLCRASNGTDVPVLSTSERAELEKVLEEMIVMLEHEEEQEQVLSLWLKHYSYCSSSDWPNLQASYDRWCTAARRLLILQ